MILISGEVDQSEHLRETDINADVIETLRLPCAAMVHVMVSFRARGQEKGWPAG